MSPEDLRQLSNCQGCLSMAAELVEAIDDPALQRQRGWDLSRWHYDLVPWGVRFIYHDPHSGERAETLALLPLGPASLARWLPRRHV
jgi:hypothetical protein